MFPHPPHSSDKLTLKHLYTGQYVWLSIGLLTLAQLKSKNKLFLNIFFNCTVSLQDACMKTYPKNGLYGLQGVCNDGCNSFGNSTDDEELNGRELGE